MVAHRRILLLIALCGVMLLHACGEQDHTMKTDGVHPVNFLRYDQDFASAGMPQEKHLKQFAEQGVDLIINVAPPDADGALVDEDKLVQAVGLKYVNIPVDWHSPQQTDVDSFLQEMRNAQGQSVVLHCQMNMRATAFAFLYRVIEQGVSAEQALADVLEIWTPNRTWTLLMNEALARHDVKFTVPVPEEE